MQSQGSTRAFQLLHDESPTPAERFEAPAEAQVELEDPEARRGIQRASAS
jgi:hypothetical protein